MTNKEIVLGALIAAGRPLASHQIWELPACVGLTRQQVSSAVGHLRRDGRIEETWEPVPGPPHGPKEVRQFRVMPQEEGLAEALAAGQALREAEAAAQSRLAAARVDRPERPIKPTSKGRKPAPGHPFTLPHSPKAPPRQSRITRDLPAHLLTPAPDDPDGATQEAQYLAAAAAAEAIALADADTAGEATTGPDAAAGDTPAANLAAARAHQASAFYTNLDTELVAELAAVCGADAHPTPIEETAMATDRPHCTGHCQHGKTADYARHGDPCAVHAEADLDNALAAATEDAPGAPPADDRPGWVADLQAWLGPLPEGVNLYGLKALYAGAITDGQVRVKVVDDGGGAYVILNARDLELNRGEASRLGRYADALAWIFGAMAANAYPVPDRCRPAGLDLPDPNAVWADDLRPRRLGDPGDDREADYRSPRLEDPPTRRIDYQDAPF